MCAGKPCCDRARHTRNRRLIQGHRDLLWKALREVCSQSVCLATRRKQRISCHSVLNHRVKVYLFAAPPETFDDRTPQLQRERSLRRIWTSDWVSRTIWANHGGDMNGDSGACVKFCGLLSRAKLGAIERSARRYPTKYLGKPSVSSTC